MKKNLLVLALIFVLAACSSNSFDADKFADASEQEIFSAAMQAKKGGELAQARETLEFIKTHYPYGELKEKVLRELMAVYYEDGALPLLEMTASEYIDLYKNKPELPYAYYMRGLANFEPDRGVLHRYLPTDKSVRDPGNVAQALSDFEYVAATKTSYAEDAKKRIVFLKDRLATFNVKVAEYYYDRKMYVAAVNRSEEVIRKYADTPEVPDALRILVKSYDKLGMHERADKMQAILDKSYS